MFGYVIANQEELKLRDFKRYRSFYCGLCHILEKKYGKRGQMALSYDMTFLVMLLNALYETPLTEEKHRCAVHPMRKHDMVFNDITEYAADMTVLLAYYKALDNWRDEKDVKSRAFGKALMKKARQIDHEWPRQSRTIRTSLHDLTEAEEKHLDDLDQAAGYFGTLLGEIFVYREDEWADDLRRMGFYLGKFIYLMDAFEDMDKDRKKNCYNSWEPYRNRTDFDARVENTLTLMMGDCARAFEVLPIVQDIDILRNILYSGVWTKYRKICARRDAKAKGDEHDS